MNLLQFESSPYLKQHANNPVDWFPWGDEAFEKAKQENKPILVSIGYSTCHWCHVMERESFEDESTARIMNEFFVNIKVDREQRPDVDQIYMDAIQLLGVSGGWPLNCFLTPDGKPFFGGTYYPPKPAYGRPSWQQVLIHVRNIFDRQREAVDVQATRLTEAIAQGHLQFVSQDQLDSNVSEPFDFVLKKIFDQVAKQFDQEHGGIGGAPKFPSTMMLDNLAVFGRNNPNGPEFSHFIFSLEKMALGGIYDQIGGGFSRYAVDAKWHIPHFEKMLYDNALLMSNYAKAYTITQDPFFKRVLEQTFRFLQRDLKSEDGLYDAAYDADSEGVEGKFYVWNWDEFRHVLGDHADLMAEYFRVEQGGNWEGTNVLFPAQKPEVFAQLKGIDQGEFVEMLDQANQSLYMVRHQRIYPGRDNKRLIGWNALLAKALVDVYVATEDQTILDEAEQILDQIINKGMDENGRLVHQIDDDRMTRAFLDDYAFVIRALLSFHEISGSVDHLLQARRLTQYAIDHFLANDENLFYFTETAEDQIVRKIELYDQAIPSGNAVMAENLWLLSKIFDQSDWRELSQQMVSRMKASIEAYPRAFPYWLRVLMMQEKLNVELVIVGEQAKEISLSLKQFGLDGLTWVTANKEDDRIRLLDGREVPDHTFIYICKDFTCYRPLTSVEEALEHLEGEYDFTI